MFGKPKQEYKYELNDGGASLLRYQGKEENVVLPDSFDGRPLTALADNAFYDCKKLVSVTIPESVASVGSGCFKNCVSLKSVRLPEKLASLGDYAFALCKELEGVSLPETLTNVPQGCFLKCKSLTRVNVGGNVTSLGEEAFSGCTQLKYLSLGENVREIGEDALKGLSDKLCLVLPEGLKNFDKKLAEGCDRLYRRGKEGLELMLYAGHETDLILDDEVNGEPVTAVGDRVFAMFAYLEKLKLPKNLISIGDGAFAGCSSLTELLLPPTLRHIGRGAFAGCGQAEGVPGYVRMRGGDLASYSGLTSLTLPEGLEDVGEKAFAGCAALKNVEIKGEDTYLGAGCFSLTAIEEFTFPAHAAEIQSELLRGCVNLKKVNIPSGVESVWDRAFEGCAALESVELPESLEVIGEGAFSSMEKLKRIDLPAKVRQIGDEAFSFDPALETVGISPENEYFRIEDGCLIDRNENALIWVPAGKTGEFTVPDDVEAVRACAFSLSALTKVSLGQNVKKIGPWAFRGSEIKELKIQNPDAVIENGILLDTEDVEIDAPEAVLKRIGEEA